MITPSTLQYTFQGALDRRFANYFEAPPVPRVQPIEHFLNLENAPV